jgi:hypothetical protein
MGHTTRLAMGISTFSLAVVAVVGVGVQSASAHGRGAPVTGTGTVSCTHAAGRIKFDPPLTATATDTSDTATARVNLAGCTATGGNVTSASFTGHATGTVTLSSDNCSAFNGPMSVSGSLTVRWTGKAGTGRLATSTLSLSSVTGLPTGSLNGNPGLSFSGQGVSGSFAGTATGEFDSAKTAVSLVGKCASNGVKVLPINAATVSQP